VAGNEQNRVGFPSWRIIANKSFLHLSKYGGEPRKFLKTLKPSPKLINLLTELSDFKSPAVYVLPLVLSQPAVSHYFLYLLVLYKYSD
jgi:hypothetical protein